MLSQTRTSSKPRRLNLSLLWLFISQAVATITGWAIVSGGQIFRAFAVGIVTTGMLVPLAVSLEAGLTAMILFEPFRGILRRLQYLIVPYSQSEPIHLITPVITFCAFILVLQRKNLRLFYAHLGNAVIIFAFSFFANIQSAQGGFFRFYELLLSGAISLFYFGRSNLVFFFPKVFCNLFSGITALYTVNKRSLVIPLLSIRFENRQYDPSRL